jgi:hypothetical protein
MARIGKRDHARILEMVDVENRKIAEVAAEYGCSTASLYALLGRIRKLARAGGGSPGRARETAATEAMPEVEDAPVPVVTVPVVDLFAAAATVPEPVVVTAPVAAAAPAAAPARAPAIVTELHRSGPIAKRGGMGAALAKPGFGLTMRTGDGEEQVSPFRSLEDLLSAVKPILRSAARSPDRVWFSIAQIDLSQLDYDAA